MKNAPTKSCRNLPRMNVSSRFILKNAKNWRIVGVVAREYQRLVWPHLRSLWSKVSTFFRNCGGLPSKSWKKTLFLGKKKKFEPKSVIRFCTDIICLLSESP